MFGITNPGDAATAGTIIGAAILALLGRRLGDALKTAAPAGDPPMVAAATSLMVEKDILPRIATALESIALCLKTMLEDQRDEHKREMDERLERIEKKLSGSPKGSMGLE